MVMCMGKLNWEWDRTHFMDCQFSTWTIESFFCLWYSGHVGCNSEEVGVADPWVTSDLEWRCWDVVCARWLHLSGNGVCLLSYQFLLLEGASGGRVAGVAWNRSCVCPWHGQGWSQLRRRLPLQGQCSGLLHTVQEPFHLLVSNGRSNYGCFVWVLSPHVVEFWCVMNFNSHCNLLSYVQEREGVECTVHNCCFLSGGLCMIMLALLNVVDWWILRQCLSFCQKAEEYVLCTFYLHWKLATSAERHCH